MGADVDADADAAKKKTVRCTALTKQVFYAMLMQWLNHGLVCLSQRFLFYDRWCMYVRHKNGHACCCCRLSLFFFRGRWGGDRGLSCPTITIEVAVLMYDVVR